MTRSSRFVVAAHALTLLARSDGALTSEYIAGSVNTNPVVIRRILAALARAGLVVTQEGAGGGGRLAKPAAEITLRAVYKAVEPDALFALHPRDPNPLCPVGGGIQAALEPTLRAAETALLDSLADTSVADLLGRLGAESS
ncbi:Rrf2 family transcriptional regulator [Gemmata sp. JC673]|uniref:Rrf2 family transcriptional regulator n=1 Tax=Gemmata algarum TaxID=2975278 RepID=A0ABU5EY30_9BACT|nr:Rrf2 family transcriptional regulator [Gemmata algarum]MDY3558718.1 Rrf2 family transcriptional regulator [Gemmata algarum]